MTDLAKPTAKTIFRDYLLMTLGVVLMAVGIYFFKFPNNFTTGGVSGISILLGRFITKPFFTPGAFVFLINGLLLIVGFLIFGKDFGVRTAYCSTLLSALIWGLEALIPMDAPLTTQPLLELIFSVALPAVGSALLFNTDSSSGGTDIVAMILRKYTTLNIGVALFCVDFFITLAAVFAFGIETGLFSILGLLTKALVVDMVLENININKCFHIITVRPEPIMDFIVGTLKRGATVLHGEGAFTHENRTVMMTVVNRTQAVMLRRRIKQLDPTAFIVITNTGEIIGKGFRGVV